MWFLGEIRIRSDGGPLDTAARFGQRIGQFDVQLNWSFTTHSTIM